jgi:cell wall-associated NlpC family hydrolase
MQFDRIKRREFLALLGGAVTGPLTWPPTARAEPAEAVVKARPFDPRITPARPDLAASHLSGSVRAERFVEGEAFEIGVSHAPLRSAPSQEAMLQTEALKGERMTVYETKDGWAWGQLAGDGYVGFVPASALRAAGPAATHKVAALRTFVFPGPSIKLPPTETLSFGSRLAIARVDRSFAITAAGGHVSVLHLAPVTTRESDFVAVAERFLGTPYLWGGKTSLGLDCSGLVQLALSAAGIAAPRDSDMQEAELGSKIEVRRDLDGLKRGDLVFWRGHVGIMLDESRLLHATGQTMTVMVEPLAVAEQRIRTQPYGPITSIKRLQRL